MLNLVCVRILRFCGITVALWSVSAAAEIVIVSPAEGQVVPLLTEAQRAYVQTPRETREPWFADNRAKRAELRRIGSKPNPVRVAWTGADGQPVTVTVFKLPNRESVYSFSGKTNELAISNLEIARDYTVEVVAGADKASRRFRTEDLAPRFMDVPNIGNMRDLGGRVGLDGRRVRQGRIYRSAGWNSNAVWPMKKVKGEKGKTKKVVDDSRPPVPGTNRLTSAGRDYPEIELTNFSPITPRIDLVSQKSDRGLSPSNILQSIRDYIDITYGGGNPQVYSNMLRHIEWIKGNLFEQTGLIGDSPIAQRIRIVRWLINGVPNYRGEFDPKIVLDKTINTRIRNYLTEADVLATDGVFDIDWNYLYDSISPRTVEAACGEPTNITYMIVIGDGPFTWTTSPQTNFVIKACNTVITRKFSFCDESRSYGPAGTWLFYYILRRTEPLPAIVNGNRVTLAWHVDIPLIDDYTAFRIKILSSGVEVHDTGLFRSPARHSDGTQRWMIKTELAPGTYDWKIAAYNSKFFHEDTSLYTNGVPFTVTGE